MKAREVLSRALVCALDRAVKNAGDESLDFEQRVHRFRKEVRRARGVLRVARAGVDDETRQRLEEMLRSATAMTSALRDGAILTGALNSLPLHASAEPARARAEASFEASAAVADAARNPEIILSRAAEGVLTVRMVMESLNLTELGSSDVADAFRDLWKRAVNAREDAIVTADREDFHAWRKRTKELRYGFEVLVDRGANLGGLLRDLKMAARAQGEITDAFLLRDALYDVDFSGVEESAEALLYAVEDRMSLGMRDVLSEFAVPFGIEDQRIRRRVRRVLRDGLSRVLDNDDEDED